MWLCQVRCANAACTGRAIIVTVTNLCPQGSTGGWCDRPKIHLDLPRPAWNMLASDPVVGVIRTRILRVPCPRRGGLTFRVDGNPFFTMVLVYNVAGPGTISRFEVSTNGGRTWRTWARNYGAVWSRDGRLPGRRLSFRLTLRPHRGEGDLYQLLPFQLDSGEHAHLAGATSEPCAGIVTAQFSVVLDCRVLPLCTPVLLWCLGCG